MKNIILKRRWIFLSGLLLAILNTPVATWAIESAPAQKLWGGVGQILYLTDWFAINNVMQSMKASLDDLTKKFTDRTDKTPIRQVINQVDSLLRDFRTGVLEKLEGLCLKTSVFGVNDEMYKLHKAAFDAAAILYNKVSALSTRAADLLARNAMPIEVGKRRGRVSKIAQRPLTATTFLIGMRHELTDLASVETIQSVRAKIATVKNALANIAQGNAQGVVPVILAALNVSRSDGVVATILATIDSMDRELDIYEHKPLTNADKINLVGVVSPHMR